MFLPFKPFIKIYLALGVFAFILLSGTCGYVVIEHYTFLQALYMTVITISTVGFGEVKPLSDAGRIFTIFLILANIGTFTYFIAQLSSYFLDGEFIKTYKFHKMKKAINELKGHTIICGFGRNGQEAARIFENAKTDFVVIEKSHLQANEISYPVQFLLNDDATRDEILIEAGIHSASSLITTLPDDAGNLFVVLTARALNPGIRIISRASNDSSVKKMLTAGANDVTMPDKLGGAHMAMLVLSPDVKEFVDLMGTQSNEQFNIVEIEAGKTSSLGELNCWNQTGATVLGLKITSGGYQLNPSSETLVKTGNKLIVMGSEEQLRRATKLISGV